VAINQGRWTVEVDGDFVIFIIGAKVRNPRSAVRSLRLLASMGTMLKHLEQHPEKGLLAARIPKSPFPPIVQYWRSFDHLEAFARDPDDPHAKVWREWMRKAIDKDKGSGIWHETYKVRAGEYEAIYQNMPAEGLGLAGRMVPISRETDSAGERIRAARRGMTARQTTD
jgi:hypothetical protein